MMAQATRYVSRSPGFSTKENSYNVNIYYPSVVNKDGSKGVETYTNNLINLQVTYDPQKLQGTPVSAGINCCVSVSS
jgi:hypothetical protein